MKNWVTFRRFSRWSWVKWLIISYMKKNQSQFALHAARSLKTLKNESQHKSIHITPSRGQSTSAFIPYRLQQKWTPTQKTYLVWLPHPGASKLCPTVHVSTLPSQGPARVHASKLPPVGPNIHLSPSLTLIQNNDLLVIFFVKVGDVAKAKNDSDNIKLKLARSFAYNLMVEDVSSVWPS